MYLKNAIRTDRQIDGQKQRGGREGRGGGGGGEEEGGDRTRPV